MESLSDPFALIGEIIGTQEIRIRIQPREGVNSPKLWLDANLQSISFFMSPTQIHSVINMISALSSTGSSRAPVAVRPINQSDFGRIEEQIFDTGFESPEDEDFGVDHFRPGGGSNDPAFFSLYGSGASGKTSMASSVMTNSNSSVSSVKRAGGPKRFNSEPEHIDPNKGIGEFFCL
jgi:hypothetical protein